MRNLTSILVLALAVTGLAGAATAQDRLGDLPLEPTVSPLPAGVELLRLENGLEVMLMPNPAQPMVGIYTQVKVGSAREDYRTSGMSHMLEHLLFNGTAKYTQEQLYDKADLAGAYNNANTTRFYTNYMMVLPSAEMATGFDLQAQMLFHSLIPAEKFAKEQGIVLGEIVQGRDRPGHQTETILEQALYAGSCLELPTVGTRATIEHMARDDVYDFYRRWYVPNNMIVTVAGGFDRAEAMALLETHYGSVAPGTVPDEAPRSAPLIEHTRTVSRRGGDQRILTLSFEAPTYGQSDFFPFLAMTRLLDLDGSGLLTAALEKLDASIRPEVGVWWEKAPGFGRLNLEFTLRPGSDPGQMYGLVQDAVRDALERGVSSEDILGLMRLGETNTLLEREQLRMTGLYIAEPLVLGGTDFFVSYLDHLRQVTEAEVAQALATWLVEAPCLAVLIEPAVAEPATAGAEPTQALPVNRSELGNGAVLVSQTNPASELTAIHLAVRGRALLDRANAEAGALDLVHRLFEEGYAGCDRICLAARLRRLGAVVKLVDDGRIPMDDYYTNGRFSFVRIEVTAASSREMLELLTEQLQFAAFTEADFERVRAGRVEQLRRLQGSARATANGLLAGALYGDNPLAMPAEGSVESLEKLSFDQVRQVYRRAFAPDNLVFSIVGPLGHDELKSILAGGLPGSGRPGPTLPELSPTAAPQALSATVGGQMGAVRLGSVVAVAPADVAALELTVAILSDRMSLDLREKQGLSYSVGAFLDVNGGTSEFSAWINPPQGRLAEGQTALVDFVRKFDAATITQVEMDKIRAARRGRLMMRRLSSMGQAYYLAMAELDHDLAGYLNGLQAYDSVTLADLQRVAPRYLKAMPLVEVTVD
jgi:predicted Zn-dependent peptidase